MWYIGGWFTLVFCQHPKHSHSQLLVNLATLLVGLATERLDILKPRHFVGQFLKTLELRSVMQILQLLLGLESERESAFLAEGKLVEGVTFRAYDSASGTATFGAVGAFAREWGTTERADIVLHISAAVLAIIGTLWKHCPANRAE